ncbi:MAG: hypothetical protein ABIH86_02720 [Planctomycetota bacterium]
MINRQWVMTVRIAWVAMVAIFFGSQSLFAGTPDPNDPELQKRIKEKIEQSKLDQEALRALYKDPLQRPGLLRVTSDDDWTAVDTGASMDDGVHRTATLSSPVSGREIIVAMPDETIDAGRGVDSDFCAHPSDPASLFSRVALCVRSGYAAPYDIFAQPIPQPVADSVSKELSGWTFERLKELLQMKATTESVRKEFDEFLRDLKQTDIPDWIKYRNAIVVREQFADGGLPKMDFNGLWRLYFDGSHVFRRAFCSPVTDATIINTPATAIAIRAVANDFFFSREAIADPTRVLPDMARFYERSEKPIAGDREDVNSPVNKMTNAYAYAFFIQLAALYDRVGEMERARDSLVSARKALPTGVIANEAVDTFRSRTDAELDRRLALLNLEQDSMTKSAELLIELIRRGRCPDPDSLPYFCHIISDQLRRTGQTARALKWKVVAKETAEPESPLAALVDDVPPMEALSDAEQTFIREIKRQAFSGEMNPLTIPDVSTASSTTDASSPANETAAVSPADAIRQLFRAAKRYYDETGKLPESLAVLTDGRYLPKTGIAGCSIEGNRFRHSASGASYLFNKTVQLGNADSFFLLPELDSAIDAPINGLGEASLFDERDSEKKE